MSNEELTQWLRDNSSGIYRPAAEAADLIEQLAESKRRDDILTAAMCEIYATVQGRSTQSIERIVKGCRDELCKKA